MAAQAELGRLAARMLLIDMGVGGNATSIGVIRGVLGIIEAHLQGDYEGVVEHMRTVAQEGVRVRDQGARVLLQWRVIGAGEAEGVDIWRVFDHVRVISVESVRIRDQMVHIQNEGKRIAMQYAQLLTRWFVFLSCSFYFIFIYIFRERS